ncbi:MAG: hypothetical protein Ct9H90mP6_09980 [Gammaproteobacteria bacterium]|nr:MAG: hypothetical protein Ct9H90mP6_09980 [Gammaproteobacteria bacterium]
MNDFERSKDKIIESDILIVLGSSLQVQPVASLPGFAVQNGKKLIIINKDQLTLTNTLRFVSTKIFAIQLLR